MPTTCSAVPVVQMRHAALPHAAQYFEGLHVASGMQTVYIRLCSSFAQ